ncbi:unnamed protein product [Blepharisma stoltei]|uniref:Peptidase M14 domain-containing protein n=1 Tax=Blepharisma stoltei TaxID=1481888 RepID=A0AAU9KSM0_9CILI|nr:unnamed protein product [Blepharisma stoltei]
MSNSGEESDESGGFIEISDTFSATETPFSMSEELYKHIQPPMPLVPKNRYTDDLPRSHQDMLFLPRFTDHEGFCSQGPGTSPTNNSVIASTSLISICDSRNNNIVYVKDPSPSGQPYNSNLLNLRKLLKNQENSRMEPVKPNTSIKPYYTPTSEDQTLVFESRFESGNLSMAIKISDNEYNLILQNDINTKGHTQWFYFRVTNTTEGLAVRFNIINLGKKDSLYNEGMKVLIHSESENKTNPGWFRGGTDISYYANGIRKPGSSKMFYTMTFAYEFKYTNDTVFFAYSFPYTYTDLMQDLQALEDNYYVSQIMARRLLCYTIAGNRCEYLTITAQGTPEQTKKRKGVVISARAHPGESVGSWMMKGVIDFLTGTSIEAQMLREAFVFKLIPMMNPDGVINGNYRCNLSGVDLNRRWKTPSKSLQPTVFAAKRLIKCFGKERPLELVCDLHGHSRRKNIFMYGCNYPGRPEVTRTFPFILSKISPFFSYSYCSFRMQKSKDATLRITMFKEARVPNVYTLEASFCGPNFGPYASSHHTAKQLQEMGKQLCLALAVYSEIDIPFCPDPQPSPDGEYSNNIGLLKKGDIVNELKNTKELLEDNEECDSSGSDSDPSEDNLEPEEYAEIMPVNIRKKMMQDKKRPSSDKRRNVSIRSFNPPTSKEKPQETKEKEPEIVKCANCGENMAPGHTCKSPAQKPKPRLSNLSRNNNLFSAFQPYYNAAGKKVRDQATQTPHYKKEEPRSSSNSQSLEVSKERNRSVSQKSGPKNYPKPERSFHQSFISSNLGEMSGTSKFWKSEKTGLPNLTKGKALSSPSWKLGEVFPKKY